MQHLAFYKHYQTLYHRVTALTLVWINTGKFYWYKSLFRCHFDGYVSGWSYTWGVGEKFWGHLEFGRWISLANSYLGWRTISLPLYCWWLFFIELQTFTTYNKVTHHLGLLAIIMLGNINVALKLLWMQKNIRLWSHFLWMKSGKLVGCRLRHSQNDRLEVYTNLMV